MIITAKSDIKTLMYSCAFSKSTSPFLKESIIAAILLFVFLYPRLYAFSYSTSLLPAASSSSFSTSPRNAAATSLFSSDVDIYIYIYMNK